jgi:hypothetical protein
MRRSATVVAHALSLALMVQVVVGESAAAQSDLHAVRSGGKWGYIDADGKMVIAPRFEMVGRFSEGLAPAALGGKFGFVDLSGQFVIPAKFDAARGFSEGLAAVSLNGSWGYLNKSGTIVIPLRFGRSPAEPVGKLSALLHTIASVDDASDFSEGLASVRTPGSALSGYIDTRGRMVIPPRFTLASDFHEGLALVEEYSEVPNVGGGFIDKTGQFVIRTPHRGMWGFSEGLAPAESNGKYGFIDHVGRFAIPATFDYAFPFHEGLAAVRLGDSFGYINKAGSLVVAPQHFARVLEFSAGLAAVFTSPTDCYYIKKDGTTAFKPPIQGVCNSFFSDGVASHLSAADRSLSYFSSNGKRIWPSGTTGQAGKVPEVRASAAGPAGDQETRSAILSALKTDENYTCSDASHPNDCREQFAKSMKYTPITLSPSGRRGFVVEVGGEIPGACGSGGCGISVLQEAGGQYAKVLDEVGELGLFAAARTVSNGYYDLIKTTRDRTTKQRFVWDGAKYTSR